jgi:hypothetical protein
VRSARGLLKTTADQTSSPSPLKSKIPRAITGRAPLSHVQTRDRSTRAGIGGHDGHSHRIAALEFVVFRFLNGLLADLEASQLIGD